MRLLQSIDDCDAEYFCCEKCEGYGVRRWVKPIFNLWLDAKWQLVGKREHAKILAAMEEYEDIPY